MDTIRNGSDLLFILKTNSPCYIIQFQDCEDIVGKAHYCKITKHLQVHCTFKTLLIMTLYRKAKFNIHLAQIPTHVNKIER